MKFIKFLNNVNNRTNGMFYTFICLTTLIISTLTMMYFDLGLSAPAESSTTTNYVVMQIIRFILMCGMNAATIALLIMILVAVKKFYIWLKDDLFVAFKDAAKEDYDIDTTKKSKVKFK